MTSTETGNQAEAVAEAYLVNRGYEILARNWRRRECEIDIVAQMQDTVHMVEVKYRLSDTAGDGLDYITAVKLKRMAYAAERWVTASRWTGSYVLSAIEVSGTSYEVTAYIDCIE